MNNLLTNHMFIYLLKLVTAIVLSGIIGYEREANSKNAGLRTCILVTLSGTMVVLFSNIMVARGLTMDAVRAPSYILTGIGFLGGGIIMSRGDKVEGITTAALLLVLVPLGILIGVGEFGLSFLCTLAIYFVLKLKHIDTIVKHHTTRRTKRSKADEKRSNNRRR